MTRFAKLTLLLIVAGAFALAGCGGDDNGLSATDQARLAAAEDAAAAAAAEAEQAKMDAAAAAAEAEQAMMDAANAEAEAEAAKTAAAEAEEKAAAAEEAAAEKPEVPEVDTSEIDAQIAELTQRLEEATATPMTPLEKLGGTKSTMSANDRAALAEKIAAQLNGMPTGAATMVNLPTVDGMYKKMTMDKRATHAAGGMISSKDGTSTDKGFLRHSFTGGPTVDLTSMGDIETLKLTNLLEVNGVDLKSFTLKETDKVMTEAGHVLDTAAATFVMAPLADGTGSAATRTTTRSADGSMSEMVKRSDTGAVVSGMMTSYVGGNKIVEYNPLMEATDGTPALSDEGAIVYLADGRTMTYDLEDLDGAGDGTALGFPKAPDSMAKGINPMDGETYATDGSEPPHALPAADLAVALRMYDNAKAPMYTTAQHNAQGYGAWLEDSFFVAYVINSEDDLILNDPDSTAMKIAWGGRAHDSDMATNLSGRGETASWKGLMVGHDMDAEAATHGDMVKGNAMITARVGEATLADNQAARTPDIVDVSLTNIINDKGTMVERVKDGIKWTNLDLIGGEFSKGSEIMGQFYDNGDEVVGQFNSEKILGVFGAREYEMMDDAMDMASGN